MQEGYTSQLLWDILLQDEGINHSSRSINAQRIELGILIKIVAYLSALSENKMNLNIVKLLNADVPTNSLKNLSLVGKSTSEVQTWVSNLSVLNIGETAKHLYTTLQELMILDVTDSTRLKIIEVLRPTISTIIESLSKHYTNQNILLDERAELIAGLAQQLRVYTAMIYRTIAQKTITTLQTQTFGLFSFGKKKDLMATASQAIHRGLTEFFYLCAETKTLYLPAYKGMWTHINGLIKQSQALGLDDFALREDNQAHSKILTIKQAYLRTILISVCNTNKLRQTEIRKIAQLSEIWVSLIQISSKPSGQDLFWVDTSLDAPPTYITQLKAISLSTLYINVQQLLSHFENLGNDPATILHPSEEALLSGSLRLHLLQTLRGPAERSNERHPENGTIEIALGLIGSHYQLANRQNFEEVIQMQELFANSDLPFIQPHSRRELDLNYNIKDDKIRQDATREYLESYQCQILNISLGGYCIRWVGTAPNVLRSGELIAIREHQDSEWSIGLIRWVQQQLNHGAEFGIEILSQRGKSCGARVLRQDGNTSDYMRAILLPEIREQNRTASIIVPILAFKSGNKISIRLGSDQVKAQLLQEIVVTQSFSQFEFVVTQPDKLSADSELSKHTTKQGAENEADLPSGTQNRPESELDSIWKTL
jgi:cyclic-di-GMP-binding protein